MTTVDGIMKTFVKTIKKLDLHEKNMSNAVVRNKATAEGYLKAAHIAEVEAKKASDVKAKLQGLLS